MRTIRIQIEFEVDDGKVAETISELTEVIEIMKQQHVAFDTTLNKVKRKEWESVDPEAKASETGIEILQEAVEQQQRAQRLQDAWNHAVLPVLPDPDEIINSLHLLDPQTVGEILKKMSSRFNPLFEHEFED